MYFLKKVVESGRKWESKYIFDPSIDFIGLI